MAKKKGTRRKGTRRRRSPVTAAVRKATKIIASAVRKPATATAKLRKK
jgi:hypothetical protein